MAEKAIKALLLTKGKPPPKLHSLDHLLGVLKKIKVPVSSIKNAARKLDEYYITTRYPGQYGGPEGLYGKTDAKNAVTAAEKILHFIRRQMSVLKKTR